MVQTRKKIKLLFVSESASLGGAPRVILDLMKHIDKNIFEVHAVFFSEGPALLEAKQYANVHSIVYKPFTNHLIELQKTYRKLPWLTKKLANIIREINPTIIHHNGLPPLHLLNAYNQNELPLVVHIHGLHGSETFQQTGYIKQLLNRTTHFISCAKVVSETAHMCMGIPYSKTTSLYNGIAINNQEYNNNFRLDYHILPQSILIGGAGSFSYAKGVDRFILIAEALINLDPNYRFVWFGDSFKDDPFQKSIKDYLVEKNLSNYFVFPGQVAPLTKYLSSLQAFIKCSRYEATPMVILESMQQSVPVIAYDVGGIKEMLPDENYLIANGNQKQLVTALHHLLQNKNAVEQLIKDQHQQLNTLFSISNTCKEFEKLILNLIETA